MRHQLTGDNQQRTQPRAMPSLPSRLRLVPRAKKLLWKAAWSAVEATAPAVKIVQLHARRVTEQAGEVLEYVRVVDEPAIIETQTGYIISRRGVLLEESLQPNGLLPNAPWRYGGLPDPSIVRCLRQGLCPEPQRFKRVVSLRHLWEWNYFVFYLDVLGKLNLLDSVGIEPDTPIVLGRYAKELPWTQQILNYSDWHGRHWVIPESDFVSADQVVYCRTRQNFKERLDLILDALHVPQQMDQFTDRVFLNRGGNSMRRLTNQDEIWEILLRFKFRMVDSAQMSIAEQIEVFAKTRYLVALHGAGLTNIIFRRGAPLNVLELQSRLYPSPNKMTSFGMISQAYGYHWERLTGEPESVSDDPQHGDFCISPSALEERLSRWFG